MNVAKFSKIINNKLPGTFYSRNTKIVAQELLGNLLVHNANNFLRIGKIVEVEAYLGQHDLACHTSRGMTKRNSVMFGPAGYAYVYLIYGMYHCFNIVTEVAGVGAAVLIRAVEPIYGIIDKTNGPGLLCKAMDIDKRFNGQNLLDDTLFIAKAPVINTVNIVSMPRIGVAYAKEWALQPLRFYIKDNPYVSKL